MKPSDFLTPDLIRLNLQSSTKEEVLKELVWMLDVREEYRPILLDMVLQREALGSTGLGEGVAIPHGRSLIVNHLHLVCGISKKGIYFQAIDRKKVNLFFLDHPEISGIFNVGTGRAQSFNDVACATVNAVRRARGEAPPSER